MTPLPPQEARGLTKYSLGSFLELASLSLPLVFSLLFLCLTGICDRFFLSRYSLQALQACATASYLASLFQIPCMRITSIAQVFVAQYKGAQKDELIGAVIWQMIWLSLLTTLLTVPLGIMTASFFFDNTSIQELASSYFNPLILGNFLFPLGAALTAFFTGQGRTHIVTLAMALSLIIHVGLNLILIFGVPSTIAPLAMGRGISGAAIATLISQAAYCLILLILFIRKKEKIFYGTAKWHLNWNLMWKCICLGTPRAIAKLITLSAWAAIVRILTRLDGDYLLVLSMTGSFCIFFSCLNEGLGQGLITITSYIIGGRKWDHLFLAIKSSFLGLVCIMGLLSIFLILIPEKFLLIFYSQPLASSQITTLVHACYGLWLFFLLEGLSWIGLSLMIAFGETKFLMVYSALTVWFFNYVPVYWAFCLLHWPAEILWLLMGIPCLASACAYALRVSKIFKSKQIYDRIGLTTLKQATE